MTENVNEQTIEKAAEQPVKGKPGPKPGWRAEKAAREAAEKAAANATPGTASATNEQGADLGTIDLVPVQPERSFEAKLDQELTLGVFRMGDDVMVPSYGTSEAACQDVRAYFKSTDTLNAYSSANRQFALATRTDSDGNASVLIPPGARVQMPTGLIFDIPQGFKLAVYPRSGLAMKDGLGLANSVAVIDSDYTKELFIVLHNKSDSRVEVKAGDRVAQIGLEKVYRLNTVVLHDAPGQKGDRVGGLGSTKVA